MSKHLVAVYGTLREGQGNWAWALNHPGAEKKGGCQIPFFKMYNTGGFPACIAGSDADVIEAEVFEVDDDTFQSLDRLEGYPHMYDRIEVDTEHGRCWIYVWNRPLGHMELIPDGDWVSFREGRLRA